MHVYKNWTCTLHGGQGFIGNKHFIRHIIQNIGCFIPKVISQNCKIPYQPLGAPFKNISSYLEVIDLFGLNWIVNNPLVENKAIISNT